MTMCIKKTALIKMDFVSSHYNFSKDMLLKQQKIQK